MTELERIEELERITDQLMEVAVVQNDINTKLVAQINRLSQAEEKATGLILPARLNS